MSTEKLTTKAKLFLLLIMDIISLMCLAWNVDSPIGKEHTAFFTIGIGATSISSFILGVILLMAVVDVDD